MTKNTVELDTKAEEAPSPNGHDERWKSFDTNDALLAHILLQAPEEELVEIPEWGVKLLCRALDIRGRVVVEAAAYDKTDKTTNYSRAFDAVAMNGCYNPYTKQKFFKEEHLPFLQANGGPTVRLAMVILRLSRMLATDSENAKKN